MNIGTRLSMSIGALVLSTSLVIGLFSANTTIQMIERDTAEWVLNEAEIGAELVAQHIVSNQNVLQTIAAMPVVKTMDRALQGPAILPLIESMGFDDLAVMDMNYNAWHIKGGMVPNLAARDYAQMTLAGNLAMSGITPSAQGAVGVAFPFLNYSVPIFQNGRVIGGLVARTNALSFSDIMKKIKGRGGSYAFMINGAGTTIAHALRPEVVNKGENTIEVAKTDPSFQPIADAMSKMLEQKQGSLSYSFGGKNLLCGFTPIPGHDMILVMSADKDVLLKEVYIMRIIIFIIMGAAVIIGFIASILLANSIARPMRQIRDMMHFVGEGDLTHSIEIKSKDEIGDLARYFNDTNQKIKGLILMIKRQASILHDIGGDLSSNMTETAAAMNQITGNIQGIKTRVIDQSASVTETNATMEQITINIDKLNHHVEKQTNSVAQSSSSIEEMLANIQSVTATLVKNTENVNSLTEASEAGHSGLRDVSADIQEIARESEGLLEINAVMENIASQTNLLSMNAAIEAAHAGEAGKGFAVVADEIRKLAENSGEQSKTISAVLKKMKSAIDKISVSTDKVIKRFEVIDSGVKVVAEQEENIRNAMEEQGQGSQQILEAISFLHEVTLQVKSGSMEMMEGSHEVINESRNLETVTEEISGGMNEMASGAEQINVAVNRVNEITIQNRENIEILVEEVSHFKLD
jgi:methyl-accepting chemotaxis protein